MLAIPEVATFAASTLHGIVRPQAAPHDQQLRRASIERKTQGRSTMTGLDILDKRFRDLTVTYFKEYEAGLLQQKARHERAAKFEKSRDKARRDFLDSTGVNVASLDRRFAKELRSQAKERQEFLDEFRPTAVSRPSHRAADTKSAATRSAMLAGSGHLVLPPFGGAVFGSGPVAKAPPWTPGSGAINSGWVFPEDPSDIRVTQSSDNDVACFVAVGGKPDPQFNVSFVFVPAATATYGMTAILAFHGFYVLRSDDSWWNCRHAEVKLTVQMNVNQYVDIGWQGFPALIDRNESNDEEVTTYDQTKFFDYTPVVLKAGDPVVVTVNGTVHAFARGSGAFAELNFNDGTANYIQPLFLSVQQM
jgi:hypothetical protein